MRRILLRIALGAAVLVVPMAAVAGISLSPIMQSWNHKKHSINAMLAGRTPYDEAQLRQDIQHYADSASLVAREVNGQTAQSRDFAARFAAFAHDSRSALGAVGQPSAVSARFNQMLGDCQSCHDIYNN
jgi:cytochrome c556